MTRSISLLLILTGLLVTPELHAQYGPSSVTLWPQYAGAANSPLVPGDAIRLAFWREPEFSGDYPVDETGVVVLPVLGQRNVSGIRPDELKQQLLEAYAEQLRNQEVQITMLRRVRILGAVNEPGLYHIDPTMTLGDAIALAGGPTSEGKMKDITIFRDGEEIRSDLDGSVRVVEEVYSGDQIMVPTRSWFSRYGAVIVASSLTATALILAAALR